MVSQRTRLVVAIAFAALAAGCAGEVAVTRPEPIRLAPEPAGHDGAVELAGILPVTGVPRPASPSPKPRDDVEVRFATLGLQHTAVVGVDAEAADEGLPAPYVADTVKLGPYWRLSGGARWDRPLPEPESDPVPGVDAEPRARVALAYAAADRGGYYAAYGNALDPAPGQLRFAAERDPAHLAVKPSDGDILEAGGKWQLFGRGLALRGAVFHSRYANAADLGGGADYSHRVRGIELNAFARLTSRWRLHGSYGLLESQVLASPDPLAVGRKVPDTAPQSAKLWTFYALERPAGVTLGGGARYVDKRMVDGANTVSVPDYVVLDAAVSYAVNERIALQLDLTNLTDARWYASAYDVEEAEDSRAGRISGRVLF